MQIDSWVVAPYKKPEHDHPDNEAFNKRVSMLRIHSEHAIGFLKGHFQSLRDLCVLIKDKKTHKGAVYWVVACISIHSFAMRCELERQADGYDPADDPFVTAGLPPMHSDSKCISLSSQIQGAAQLARGKQKREQLKAAWIAENELQEYGEYE